MKHSKTSLSFAITFMVSSIPFHHMGVYTQSSMMPFQFTHDESMTQPHIPTDSVV